MMSALFDESKFDFTPVIGKNELPEGERLFLEIDDQPVVIVNLKGELFAFSDMCTHDGETLGDGEIEGYEIICPRHGARFDLRTGEVTRLPASERIPVYPVRFSGDFIEFGFPKE